MRPPSYLVSYIGRIIANIWHLQALRISRDIKAIKVLEVQVEKKWQGMCPILSIVNRLISAIGRGRREEIARSP